MNNPSDMGCTVFNIGELARATGVSTKTIRFYEKAGLMPAARRAGNGYRLYTDRDAQWLRGLLLNSCKSLPLLLQAV